MSAGGGPGRSRSRSQRASGPDQAPTVINVVLAGLGGQGVIKASDILADAALRSGLDVKKSEVHGMSQRGGSVTSDVRFGRTAQDKVLSPMVPRGEADYLVVLAESEVEVARAMLRPGGVLLSPDLIPDPELPNKRSLNVALIGALSSYLELPVDALLAAVQGALPERLHGVNTRAFELGRSLAAAGGRPPPRQVAPGLSSCAASVTRRPPGRASDRPISEPGRQSARDCPPRSR